MNVTHYPDPEPLYVPEPGTDDEPWTVPEPDPPADHRSRALAVLIVALVVVAIVWRLDEWVEFHGKG